MASGPVKKHWMQLNLEKEYLSDNKKWVVEYCPFCVTPRIIRDSSEKVFHCRSIFCWSVFCRDCWKPKHVPEPCGNIDNILMQLNLEKKYLSDNKNTFGWVVEYCPFCAIPRIIRDSSEKVFRCRSIFCWREFCRDCWKPKHFPEPCGNISNIWTESSLMKEEFKIVRVKPQRYFDEEDFLATQYRIAESQFARMQKQNKLEYKITSIDVVYNARLRTKFDLRKNKLKNRGCGNSLLVFHGTPQYNIKSILKYNFDLSKRSNGRVYGDGVYFSEMPEVSLGYTKDQRSLILCQVLPGDNSKEVPSGSNDARCWAIVVPRVDQILPRFVINFKN